MIDKLSTKCNFYWTWNTPLIPCVNVTSSDLSASGDFMCGVGVPEPEDKSNLSLAYRVYEW